MLRIFLLSSACVQGVRFLIEIIGPNVIELSEWGLWQQVLIYSNYLIFLNFGISNSVNSEGPKFLARNNVDELFLLKKTAFWFTNLIVLFSILLSFIFKETNFHSVFIYLPSLWLYGLVQVELKSTNNFKKLSKINFLYACLIAVGAWTVKALQNISFLPIFFLIASLITYWICFAKYFVLDGTYIKVTSLRFLVTRGFSLMLSGVLFLLIIMVDKQILNIYGDPFVLGQFALSSSIFTLMIFPSMIVSQYFYPKQTVLIHNGKFLAAATLVMKQIRINLFTSLFLASIGYFIIEALIVNEIGSFKFIKNYFVYHLLSGVIVSLWWPFTNKLIALGKRKEYLLFQLLFLTVSTFISGVIFQYSESIIALCISQLFIYTVFLISIYFISEINYEKQAKKTN